MNETFKASNFAFEFQGNGNGGIYLNEYFNTLWNNENICSEDIGF